MTWFIFDICNLFLALHNHLAKPLRLFWSLNVYLPYTNYNLYFEIFFLNFINKYKIWSVYIMYMFIKKIISNFLFSIQWWNIILNCLIKFFQLSTFIIFDTWMTNSIEWLDSNQVNEDAYSNQLWLIKWNQMKLMKMKVIINLIDWLK